MDYIKEGINETLFQLRQEGSEYSAELNSLASNLKEQSEKIRKYYLKQAERKAAIEIANLKDKYNMDVNKVNEAIKELGARSAKLENILAQLTHIDREKYINLMKQALNEQTGEKWVLVQLRQTGIQKHAFWHKMKENFYFGGVYETVFLAPVDKHMDAINKLVSAYKSSNIGEKISGTYDECIRMHRVCKELSSQNNIFVVYDNADHYNGMGNTFAAIRNEVGDQYCAVEPKPTKMKDHLFMPGEHNNLTLNNDKFKATSNRIIQRLEAENLQNLPQEDCDFLNNVLGPQTQEKN